MTYKDNDKMKRFNFVMPVEMDTFIRELARETDRPPSRVIREGIELLMEEYKKGGQSSGKRPANVR